MRRRGGGSGCTFYEGEWTNDFLASLSLTPLTPRTSAFTVACISTDFPFAHSVSKKSTRRDEKPLPLKMLWVLRRTFSKFLVRLMARYKLAYMDYGLSLPRSVIRDSRFFVFRGWNKNESSLLPDSLYVEPTESP